MTAVKNEALDVAAVVAQYKREVEALKAQLAALTGGHGVCCTAAATMLQILCTSNATEGTSGS